MNLPKILQLIRPGAEWSLAGTEYDDLQWLDQNQTKPTLEECQAADLSVSYREARRSAYPSIGDQLDALWKGGQAAIDMKAIIDAVKITYPKP